MKLEGLLRDKNWREKWNLEKGGVLQHIRIKDKSEVIGIEIMILIFF